MRKYDTTTRKAFIKRMALEFSSDESAMETCTTWPCSKSRMGKDVQLFEEEIADYLGTDLEVICVNTGTAALHLALLLS